MAWCLDRRDHDCAVFCDAKWVLGLYLGSGKAGAAYGAASSLITLLLWICYSSQILLFGAEFTQVYVDRAGHGVSPDQHAVRVETKEVENQRAESSENDRRRSAIALAEITVIQPIWVITVGAASTVTILVPVYLPLWSLPARSRICLFSFSHKSVILVCGKRGFEYWPTLDRGRRQRPLSVLRELLM
jgi:hypothetical protein